MIPFFCYRNSKKSNQPWEKVTNLWEKVTKLDGKVTEQSQKVSEQDGKVSELGEKVSEQERKSDRVRLTAKQRKVLEFCDETPCTSQEILEMVGVKYHTKTLEQYINKLEMAGVLRPTTIHKNDSNRKYITAHDEE